MSANLLTYLQSELISLSNEAKKKHPEIKEAAERLLYTLKSTKDKAPSSPSTPVSIAQDFVAVELSNIKTDEVLKPFLLSCETKNPKLSSISVNCLQKLISHNAISDISIPSILKTLESISNSGMEMQLKILQTLLPLITNYPSIHGPVLANALSLCFRLHDSKNMVVNGIASATLRQLVTHVFDKVAEEESHELGKGDSGDSILNLPPCTKDAYMLFQDLCLFSNKGETGLFLLKITSVSKSFVLELIEEILSSHHVLFKSHPELLTLLKERTCPLVIRSFSDKNEFSLTLRLMRVLQIILVRFHDTLIMEVEIFLTLLGKLLEPDYAPSWQRVVVMEIYRDICNDNSLLRYTYRSYDTQDHTTKLFQEMAISFTRIIVAERPHFLFTVPTADNSASNAESYALSSAAASVKMRCIDQLEKTEPPSLPEGYLLYLAIHAISDLVDGMLAYILPTSKLSQGEMSENDRREYATAIEMPKACWSTILATLSFLIPASLDNDIFSLVIRTLQNFTVLVGILGLNSQRDAFLSSICKSCLPGSTYQGKGKHGSLIGERNIVCLKAVLGVSKILMSNLDEKAWYLILDSLQTAEDLLSSGKTGRKENNDVENYFVDTLQNIKTFCDITKTMDGRSAEEFVKALCHLAKDACTLALQNHSPSSSSKEALPQSISRNEEKSFALSRLFDFASLNITRLIVSNPVPSITGSAASSPPFQTWDIIIKSLIDISHHPQCPSSLKSQATFTLSEILNAAMQYGDLSDEVVEMKILAPLKSLMVIESDESLLVIEKIPRMIEIEKSGLEILNRLLQTAGQNIKCGWGLILEIVRTAPNLEKNSSTQSGRSVLVRIAFPSLQLICTDFLALLTPAILYDCIETLGRFGAQMDDVNISLTSIGLLWSVSDFLLTQKHAQPELVQEIVSTASLHHAKPFVRSKSMVNLLSDDKAEHRHDVLWMFLLSHFSQLCADSRPEVRNSANQTLFRTIGLNGKKLTLKAWEECFLNILFPLLERVKISSLSVDELAASPANNAKQQQQTLMVHHSRDTTSKQWDETKVLSINGVTNAFIDFLPNLLKLANFETYNAKFLDYIKDWYLSGSPEVSIASIKSLKQMIGISKDGFGEGLLDPLYLSIWSTWEAIGLGLLPANHDSEKLSAIYGPLTQDSLLSYVSVFCELFKEIKSSFELSQLERMCTILFVVSLYHTVHSSTDRYQNKTNDLDITTPLQSLIIYILVPPAPDSCRDDPLDTPLERLTVSFSHIEGSAVVLIDTISKFTMFPFIERGNESNGSVFTYIALARKSMEFLVTLFKSNSNLMGLYSSGTFSRVIQNLGTAMKIKYDCPNVGTKNPTPLWKSACDSFISIIKMGLEAIKNGIDDLDTKEVDNIYANILNILEGFLLPKVEPIGASAEDEAFDISVLHVLKTELLLYFGLPYVKDNMLAKFIQIFVSGSHLYIVRSNEILPSDSSKAINTRSAHKGGQLMVYGGADGLKVKVPPNYNLGSDVEIIGREDFARSCIDFLFEICSTKMTDEPIMRHRIASIAAPMLLQKCTDILTNYVRDRPLFGKMPLPRIRNEEIMFILRHLELLDARKCILIDESDKSDVLRWTILSGSCSFLFTLYPLLCTLLCTISLTEIPSGSEDSDESNVVVSMKCVLNRIGKELGLNK